MDHHVDQAAGADPAGAAEGSAERPARLRLGWFALAAAALVLVPVGLSRMVGEPKGVDRVFEIPLGAAGRIAAGEDLEVLPADLHVSLADRLVVVNRDVAAHQVGPYTVAPGERLEQRFADVASFSGFCSLHPGGEITINVRPR
ncbi:MAG: hypothetical protein ACKVWR_21615 [Acidimicrobiales bacterium]